LIKLAGNRATNEGVLIIEAKRYRSQEKNREDAIQRLARLVEKALVEPRRRKATRPSAAARAKRLEKKKKRGETKRLRQMVSRDGE